ncbi:MAG: hypothetical protein Q8Q09_17725 [Deltaproteobacteria bacterium]|nr:hypothetical protein [Deltaproteobacteria bacterium]
MSTAAPPAGMAATLGACSALGELRERTTVWWRWSLSGAPSEATLRQWAIAQGFAADRSVASEVFAGSRARWSMTAELTDGNLVADVYFLSAGRRYGLLSVVHGPRAAIIQPPVMAAWLETIEGATPWGAPESPDLRARCPSDFSVLANGAARTVVRCMTASGTRAFAMLQLIQAEGGFGSTEDRQRMAGDIARRVAASGSGGQARVLVQPTPFTAARNVDAMWSRFETDEPLTLARRVEWFAPATSGNLSFIYQGVDDPDVITALAAHVGSQGPRSLISWPRLAAWTLGVSALFALLTALRERVRARQIAEQTKGQGR